MRNLHPLATPQERRHGAAPDGDLRAGREVDVPATEWDLRTAPATAAGTERGAREVVAAAVIVNHRHQISHCGGRPVQPNVRIAPLLAVDFYAKAAKC